VEPGSPLASACAASPLPPDQGGMNRVHPSPAPEQPLPSQASPSRAVLSPGPSGAGAAAAAGRLAVRLTAQASVPANTPKK
jgi:hypothetical protein